MKRLLVLIGLCLLAAACGSDTPITPTRPPITGFTFTGVYSGAYVITTCTDVGGGAGLCAGFPPGRQSPISLSLGQNQTSVSGTIMLGSIGGTFQGVAKGNGLLGTAAMNNLDLFGSSATFNITAWDSTLNGNSMTGVFVLTIRIATLLGGADITANLSQLTR